MSELTRLEKLEEFFRTVADLTMNHDVLTTRDSDGYTNDYAVVFPNRLGVALEKVDKEWWKTK